MPNVILNDRCLIRFSGPEAEHLLHNVLTCNIETLQPNIAQICALLTPQGKIMFDFLISRSAADTFIIEIEKEHAPAFTQRMMMYRLRSKVEIVESSESFVRISWGDDSTTSSNALRDLRFKKIIVKREYLDEGSATDQTQWNTLRIENGVPESGTDYALNDVFCHDVSFDQNGGVDFKKGCYIGQEIVSRMHHRGTARRRVLIAKGDAILGSESNIVANEKPVGNLGTRVGDTGLALCRIDKVKDAMESGHKISIDNKTVTLTLPENVTYSWPEETKNA